MTAILCVCLCVCNLWFDNLYGGFVTFLSLRPFHLLYPLSLSSMETFIQSLFAFPFGESFFIVICRISHPSLLTQSFWNCQIWSTVHHFKYILVKCRSGLIGCDDVSGRLNIICPKTCPVNPTYGHSGLWSAQNNNNGNTYHSALWSCDMMIFFC